MSSLAFSSTFELLCEVAIAVAGFAGVAAALGGRDRSFGQIELLRLRGLFQYSAVILGGCFALFALDAAGVGFNVTIRVVSFGVAFAFAAVAATSLPPAYRMALSADRTQTTPGGVYFVMASYAVMVPLCLVNGLLIVREWPLLVAFSIAVLMALWIFNRLLTRPG